MNQFRIIELLNGAELFDAISSMPSTELLCVGLQVVRDTLTLHSLWSVTQNLWASYNPGSFFNWRGGRDLFYPPLFNPENVPNAFSYCTSFIGPNFCLGPL